MDPDQEAGAKQRWVRLTAFQWITIALLMAALVIDGLDYQLLALVAPVILAEWGIDRGSFGIAMAAALFGMAFGAAAGGWLGDRIGRVRALTLAIALFGGATVAVSATGDVVTLAALRVLGGIGFGAAGPNAIALASEWLPARLRTHAIALLAIGTPAGGMIGALIIPQMLPAFGWRGVFVGLGMVAVALAAGIFAVLRESPQWLARRDGRAGGATVTGSEAQAGGTARLFSPAFLELNLGVGLGFAALTAIVYGLGSWMPSFLTAAGFTLEQALTVSFVFNACSILGALSTGWLVRSFGSRTVIFACTGLTCVLLLGFGQALESLPADPPPLARIGIDALAGSVGGFASIAVTTLYALTASLYPPEIRSSGVGLGMTMGRIGGILMSFLGGYLLDLADGSAAILFGGLAICAVIATGAGWLVRDSIR